MGIPEAGPRAAVLYTVVASAVRHDLDVWAYLRDVLERLACAMESEHGSADLTALLPDVWAQSHPRRSAPIVLTNAKPTPRRLAPVATDGVSWPELRLGCDKTPGLGRSLTLRVGVKAPRSLM